MLTQRRLWIYGSQFVLIGGFLYALTRTRLQGLSTVTLWASVTTAWLFEGVVLTVIGEPLVANELDPHVAWYFWLVATAGPLQPVAAFAGGRLGLRHARTAERVVGDEGVAMRWTARPWLAVLVLAVAIAAGAWAVFGPKGQPVPSSGEPQVGVGYRVTFYCVASFPIGDTWWDFDGWDFNDPSAIKWPPPSPVGLFESAGDPYPVRGNLTLTSEVKGNFVAEVDRSVLPVSRSPRGGLHSGGCL
jgi:hypothetical protein